MTTNDNQKPAAPIGSIFDARVKHQVPELVELLGIWSDAQQQVEEWQAEAEQIWSDLVKQVQGLLEQALIDDPVALPKLGLWLKQHLGLEVDVVMQLHRSTSELADVIAHAVVSAGAGLMTRSLDLQDGIDRGAGRGRDLAHEDARPEE